MGGDFKNEIVHYVIVRNMYIKKNFFHDIYNTVKSGYNGLAIQRTN